MNLIEKLFEFLAGLLTAREIRAQGAEPIAGATFTLPIAATGYTAPQPPAGVLESRDIAHCTPYLQERWPQVRALFRERTGRELFLTCTWRSRERQGQLYAQGRTAPGPVVTKVDGIKKIGRHNFFPSKAFDVCVDADPGPGKHPVWDREAYTPLGPICAELGLQWGGDWNGDGVFAPEDFDRPHIQEPAGVL